MTWTDVLFTLLAFGFLVADIADGAFAALHHSLVRHVIDRCELWVDSAMGSTPSETTIWRNKVRSISVHSERKKKLETMLLKWQLLSLAKSGKFRNSIKESLVPIVRLCSPLTRSLYCFDHRRSREEYRNDQHQAGTKGCLRQDLISCRDPNPLLFQCTGGFTPRMQPFTCFSNFSFTSLL